MAREGGGVAGTDPLPVRRQWQLPRRPAQIVSRFRSGVKLAEHFVHSVDDGLGLISLNIVPAMLNHTVHAARRKMRQRLVMGVPLLSKVAPEFSFRPIQVRSA